MAQHECVALPAAKRLPAAERISMMRQRINSERVVTRAAILVALPRMARVARFAWKLKGVPQLAARSAALFFPVASIVFRNASILRTVVRVWGLARLVRGVASGVVGERGRPAVRVVAGAEGSSIDPKMRRKQWHNDQI